MRIVDRVVSLTKPEREAALRAFGDNWTVDTIWEAARDFYSAGAVCGSRPFDGRAVCELPAGHQGQHESRTSLGLTQWPATDDQVAPSHPQGHVCEGMELCRRCGLPADAPAHTLLIRPAGE